MEMFGEMGEPDEVKKSHGKKRDCGEVGITQLKKQESLCKL